MLMRDEREAIVEYCIKLIEHGLTKGTGGNISVFDREKKIMAISPGGMDYYKTKPEDVVVMDLDGTIVDGNRKPSSEYLLHKIFYERREDCNSVVHCHSMFSAVLACLRWPIPATHYMIALAGKDVRCAEYATFGTQQLAENAFEAMKDRNAALMGNHGLLAVAPDLPNAFNIAEEIEFCAEIYYRGKCVGEPVVLSDAEMELMLLRFQQYSKVNK
ncbi:L-fuculose-phosphate aldolase [Anoxybacterium hadale]|uniref:L-fuculose-phosphate aldolase n=1 Tax=Anoxybacterium hadale TaxID=3408580 RepID=A0ACD1A916_9FIRM|nr:L-fuculose-phosphate aldolase [Clostridiales bacterium]